MARFPIPYPWLYPSIVPFKKLQVLMRNQTYFDITAVDETLLDTQTKLIINPQPMRPNINKHNTNKSKKIHN